jgi:hypothetical protein
VTINPSQPDHLEHSGVMLEPAPCDRCRLAARCKEKLLAWRASRLFMAGASPRWGHTDRRGAVSIGNVRYGVSGRLLLSCLNVAVGSTPEVQTTRAADHRPSGRVRPTPVTEGGEMATPKRPFAIGLSGRPQRRIVDRWQATTGLWASQSARLKRSFTACARLIRTRTIIDRKNSRTY